MQIERKPLIAAQQKVKSVDVSISAMAQIASLLDKLSASSKALESAQMLVGRTVSTSDAAVATVNVISAAVATVGSVTLTDAQLAKSHILAFANQDASVPFQSGSFEVSNISSDFGSIANQTFALTGKSLEQVRDEINTSALAGQITASIVNTLGASGYVLLLTGSKTGSTATFDATLDGNLPSNFQNDPAPGISQVAANASARVNGITVASKSNSFSEAIPGVSFNLLKASSATTTITVTDSKPTIKERLRSVAADFTALNQKLVELSRPKSATEAAGPLAGNSAILSLALGLREKFFAGFTITGAVGNGNKYTWSNLGLELQRSGAVTVRESDLAAAIDGTTQPANAEVRIGEEMIGGFASELQDFLKKATLSGVTDIMKTNRARLSSSVDDIDGRLERTRKSLLAKYAALDSKLASLSQLSANVRSSLAGLSIR